MQKPSPQWLLNSQLGEDLGTPSSKRSPCRDIQAWPSTAHPDARWNRIIAVR